jgi:hypothetical protein
MLIYKDIKIYFRYISNEIYYYSQIEKYLKINKLDVYEYNKNWLISFEASIQK